MVKLTVITKVDDNNIILEKNMDTLLKSTNNIKLIYITNGFSLNSKNNDKIIVVDSLNEALFNTSDSEYVLFIDSSKVIDENALDIIIERLENNLTDILIFNNNNQYHEDMTTISRITGNTNFTHEKIKYYLLNIDETIFSKIYRKEFLMDYFDEIDLTHSELINIKTLLQAKKISFINEILYKEKQEYMKYIDTEYYNKYVINQKNILNFLKNGIYEDASKNNFIKKLINKFDEVGVEYKKESFHLLRNSFLEILENDTNKDFISCLAYTNRKIFEQTIITESIEEYDLLKKVFGDKKSINYKKRYEKILQSEEKKIKNFNKSLTSSNSWQLTKIFRLIRLKWF